PYETSVDELTANGISFSVSPNPADEDITFYFDEGNSGEIRIYDYIGAEIRRIIIDAGSINAVWNGEDINGKVCSSGIYNAILIRGGKTVRIAFVIRK
ncbi:MAG: FlgD ig protein, partial [Bacteroidota bacterium]|nr:FlgD ig protein [Bacteroidota bacterium]